jgi:hypothetical protein
LAMVRRGRVREYQKLHFLQLQLAPTTGLRTRLHGFNCAIQFGKIQAVPVLGLFHRRSVTSVKGHCAKPVVRILLAGESSASMPADLLPYFSTSGAFLRSK